MGGGGVGRLQMHQVMKLFISKGGGGVGDTRATPPPPSAYYASAEEIYKTYILPNSQILIYNSPRKYTKCQSDINKKKSKQ